MKHFLTLWMTLLMTLSTLTGAAAETTATYQDDIYSFQYPAAWRRGAAKDGTITLRIPDSDQGVMTFALATTLIQLTGNPAEDDTFIRQYISSEGGKITSHLKLDGTYEALQQGSFLGFRAFGKVDGKEPAHFVLLTGEGCMITFIFIGNTTFPAEDAILSSVQVAAQTKEEASANEDYLCWNGSGFTVQYPKAYGTMEQKTGTVFLEMTNKKDMVMVRKFNLKKDFDDAMALTLAKEKLPKSTKVKAEPTMVQVGDWNAAIITGDTGSADPMAFYIIGSGRTALGILILGKNALTHAEYIVSTATIGQ